MPLDFCLRDQHKTRPQLTSLATLPTRYLSTIASRAMSVRGMDEQGRSISYIPPSTTDRIEEHREPEEGVRSDHFRPTVAAAEHARQICRGSLERTVTVCPYKRRALQPPKSRVRKTPKIEMFVPTASVQYRLPTYCKRANTQSGIFQLSSLSSGRIRTVPRHSKTPRRGRRRRSFSRPRVHRPGGEWPTNPFSH